MPFSRRIPSLREQVGKTLITTDGTTLLGGDDKAGIAEILVAAEELIQEKETSWVCQDCLYAG